MTDPTTSVEPTKDPTSGVGESPFKGPYFHMHGKIWMPSAKGGDTFVLDVRGWGYLTGRGGALGLDEDEAAKIQDAFGDKVAAALNAYETPAKPQSDRVKELESALRDVDVHSLIITSGTSRGCSEIDHQKIVALIHRVRKALQEQPKCTL